MDTYILYGVTVLLLSISFFKDKQKTKLSLKKAWKAFENILPQFLVVILLVGVLLAVLNADVISKMIGSDSGGAGYMQIGAFVSALMMVGVVTMPIEIKYFGLKLTIWRNALAFVFSFLVAYIIGLAVG